MSVGNDWFKSAWVIVFMVSTLAHQEGTWRSTPLPPESGLRRIYQLFWMFKRRPHTLITKNLFEWGPGHRQDGAQTSLSGIGNSMFSELYHLLLKLFNVNGWACKMSLTWGKKGNRCITFKIGINKSISFIFPLTSTVEMINVSQLIVSEKSGFALVFNTFY